MNEGIFMKFEAVFPILGFENIKEYELSKIDDLFFSLKNSEEKIEFTLVNPFAILNYDFSVDKEFQKALEIDENSNILTLNLMVIAKPLENSTINFAAPLIFNFDSAKMGQFVIESGDYGLAEKLINFIEK